MDKNTLIGLGLIGTLLVTFTILNKPKELDQNAPVKNKTELESSKVSKDDAVKSTPAENNSAKVNSTSTVDNTQKVVPQASQKEEIIRLETDKIIYDFSTKGG